MNDFVTKALAALEDEGRLRDVRPARTDAISFDANDYLGLAAHPAVREAVAAAVLEHGMGPRGSALLCGHTDQHEALEKRLAAFVGQPAAVLTPTGYAANLAVFDTLAGDDLHIFSDALNHASIVDACHRAKRRGASVDVYEHADADDLERRLAESTKARKLVVTETLFSMDGDRAPIEALASLRERYGFTLVTDESHATLVFEPCGIADVHVGTASKALGALGGFVACDAATARLLRTRARTYVFSTALPVPVVAAIDAALGVDHEPLRERLWANTRRLCRAFDREVVSPIVPFVIGEERATMRAGHQLAEAGFLVAAVRPPTVPVGTSRLRVTVSAAHRDTDIDGLIAALRGIL